MAGKQLLPSTREEQIAAAMESLQPAQPETTPIPAASNEQLPPGFKNYTPKTSKQNPGFGPYDVGTRVAPGAALPFGAGRDASGAPIPDVGGTSTVKVGKFSTAPLAKTSRPSRAIPITGEMQSSLQETAKVGPSGSKKTETEEPAAIPPGIVNLDAAGGKNFQPYIAPERRKAADLAPTFGKGPAAQPRTLISTTPRDMKKAIPDEHTITEIKNNQSYNTLGQELARNPGDVDGGNVSQMKMTGTELDPEEQAAQDALNARRDANSAALDSYNETLSQANILEGAHGSQAGRRALSNIAAQQRKAHENQLKELEVKYGINLKERELAQQAPKVAAETKQLLANADYLERQSKLLTGKNATEAKFILDRAKALDKLIAATDDPVEQEKYRSLIESMGQRIVELDSTANAAPAAPAAPKVDEGMINKMKVAVQQDMQNSGLTKDQAVAKLKAKGIDDQTIQVIIGA